MEAPHIRRATATDVPHIVRLIGTDPLGASVEQLGPPLPPAYARAFAAIDADPRCELLVMTLADQVVGTLQVHWLTYLSFGGSEVAQVESVHVDPAQQGRGLGTQLMHWVVERARGRGCHRVQLTTRKTRLDAHRFYRKLGFEATHEGMKLLLKPAPPGP